MQGVRFISEIDGKPAHEYRSRATDEKFVSMTTFVGAFKQPFDKAFWSFYKAVQYKLGIPDARKGEFSSLCRKYGMDWNNKSYLPLFKICIDNGINAQSLLKGNRAEVLDMWKEISDAACDKGTIFHDSEEEKSYKTGVTIVGKVKAITQERYSFDLSELADGGHNELLIYSKKYKLCGKADLTYIESVYSDRYVDLDDYKTNKQIKTSNSFQKMKFPLGHLDDCNYNHYALQINGYANLLTEFDYKIRNLQFTHCDVDDQGREVGPRTPYPVPNLQKEIELMKKYAHMYGLKI